jgi:diguanylate cyclase (GGDEF)-like protein
VSCSELFGKKKNEIIGKDFRDFEPLSKVGRSITQSMKGGAEDFKKIFYNNRQFEVSILPFMVKGKPKFLRIIFKDITRFVHLENELLKRNKELIIMSTLSNAFISTENMDYVIEDLLDKVLLITDFTIGWLILKEGESYKLMTGRGISAEFHKNIKDGILDAICRDAAATGEPLYILESSEISKNILLHKEGISFLTAVPLFSGKVPAGFLFLANGDKKTEIIDFDIVSLLSLVGNHVSLILGKLKLFQETKRLSITDSLTGLYNRRYFYKHLDIEFARSKRYGNAFSVMLFDIDNFKNINDTFGHQAGDIVLQRLAGILKSVSRETDVVVRYGGEEFIVLLPSTSEEEAIALAERIKNTVEKTVINVNNFENVNITLSGGIASFPISASDTKTLLSAADSALYSAKGSGRNKIICFKGKLNEKSIQKTSKP